MKELIQRCQQGDPSAWEELFRSYQSKAMLIARQLAGNYHLVEDLVQEAFVRAMNSISTFKGETKPAFSSWFSRIIHNLYWDELRKTMKNTISWESLSNQGSNIIAQVVSIQSQFESQLLFLQGVKESLRKLSELDRMVFFLREFLDYSYQEIASRLSLSVESVRARLFRVRRILRREFALSGWPY